MPEAVASLESYVTQLERSGDGVRRHYNVAICADPVQFERVAGERLHWTNTWEQAHFFIAPTHMGCANMLDGNVVAAVERMGVVIGVVKDRRTIIGQEFRK